MQMRMVIAVVMFIFWVAIAYIEFQRGERRLAAAFLLAGIVLTAFRYRMAKKAADSANSRKP
jgi:hypothetical protein